MQFFMRVGSVLGYFLGSDTDTVFSHFFFTLYDQLLNIGETIVFNIKRYIMHVKELFT